MIIRTLLFLTILSAYLNANVKYDIFITSYTKDKKTTANEYQKILKEYLLLHNIKEKVSLNEEQNVLIIKIVNFNTLDEAKKILNIISNDFKDSFIQEKEIKNLDNTHKEAMTLLKDEKVNEAYEVLYNSYQNNHFNKQTIFLLANSAKQKGDIKNAIKYYEILLQNDPNAHRVRLELASLYYDDNQLEKSNEQFLIVKSAKIPKQVESNIDNYYVKKQLEKQKNYNFFGSLAYIVDSNVNLGPNIDSVTMYDIDFTLSSDAKESDDTAISLRAGAEYYNQFKDFTLKTSLNTNKVDYSDKDDYDTSSISLSTSAVIFRDNTLYMIPITYSNIDIGNTDSYLKYISLSPMFKKPLGESIIYSLKLKLDKKEYKNLSQKDGLTYGLNYGLEFLEDKTSSINVNTYFNKNDSKDDIYSYYNIGVRLSYSNTIYPRTFFIGNMNYETSSYKKAEDAFTTKKDENNLNASVNFVYDLNYHKSNVMFSYYKQKNSSNIELYRYDRDMATLSFNIQY